MVKQPQAQRKSVDDEPTPSTKQADEAVKAFLATLGGTKQRGRQAKPKPDYKSAVEGLTDPLQKLAAIRAERERVDALVAAADPVEGFKLHAKAWAKANGYTREDFRAIGVPNAVLVVVFGETKAKEQDSKPKGTEQPGKVIAKRIAAAPKGEVFTIAGLKVETGATDQTIAKALAGAMTAGQLSKAEDASYTGRGRKPNIYTKL